jgi:hypothetical protein
MDVKVGTFNLNNVFSRFNFKAHVEELPKDERDVTVAYEFNDEGDYWFRTFRGRLIQPMPEEQRQTLAGRIKAMDLDVLAVQEVEDTEALNDFNRFHLGRRDGRGARDRQTHLPELAWWLVLLLLQWMRVTARLTDDLEQALSIVRTLPGRFPHSTFPTETYAAIRESASPNGGRRRL